MMVRFAIKSTPLFPQPLPKLRMTGRQSWKPQAQRYALYKGFVVACFMDALPDRSRSQAYRTLLACKKPIRLPKDARARMDISIVWTSDRRADSENVFGALADALFENDKNLAGSFDFAFGAKDAGGVWITLELPDDTL